MSCFSDDDYDFDSDTDSLDSLEYSDEDAEHDKYYLTGFVFTCPKCKSMEFFAGSPHVQRDCCTACKQKNFLSPEIK